MSAIETAGLTKYYGETRGVEDLSLTVERGEVFGFLGPNGAGKTTTIRTLMGFQSPTAGTATVLDRDVREERSTIEARRRIGYLPSEPGFDETVTGRRLLRYYGSLRGDERSASLLERFDPPLDREVGDYSRGNVQKLAIVVAFMHDPDLLIMDEPTSGLDPLMQERFYEFVREERGRGKTVFFSSHILSEVRKICDRVGIVRGGRLVEVEDVETLLARNGKTVRVRVAESVDAPAFDVDGVHGVDVRSRGAGRAAADGEAAAGTTVEFTYTGDYNALLERLLAYTVLDLDVEEAPLEDVFMRFYDEDGARAGRDAAARGAPEPETTEPADVGDR